MKPRVLRSGRRDQWKRSSGPQVEPNISLLHPRRLRAGGGAFTLDFDLSLLHQNQHPSFAEDEPMERSSPHLRLPDLAL